MKLRARMLRPGFFSSEQVLNCSMPARLLFQGLWCLADKEGRLEDRPNQIKLLILPLDKVNVEKLLTELAAAELIVRYEVEQQRCIWIPKFVENQHPHPHEAGSVLPACNYISSNSSTKADVITSNGKPVRLIQEQVQDPSSPDPEIKNQDRKAEKVTPEDLVEAWNEYCAPAGFARVEKLTSDRRQLALRQIHEHPEIQFWERVFAKVPHSPFMRGLRNDEKHKNWKADFEFLMTHDRPVKVVEGKYDG